MDLNKLIIIFFQGDAFFMGFVLSIFVFLCIKQRLELGLTFSYRHLSCLILVDKNSEAWACENVASPCQTHVGNVSDVKSMKRGLNTVKARLGFSFGHG